MNIKPRLLTLFQFAAFGLCTFLVPLATAHAYNPPGYLMYRLDVTEWIQHGADVAVLNGCQLNDIGYQALRDDLVAQLESAEFDHHWSMDPDVWYFSPHLYTNINGGVLQEKDPFEAQTLIDCIDEVIQVDPTDSYHKSHADGSFSE